MEYYTYSFEKLEVWKDSKELTKLIYMVTEKFPKNEIYVIVPQMRRAAISISSNIAEGCGRTNTKDQAHFYQIAYSSTIELLNQLIIAFELKFMSDDQYVETRLVIERVSNKINALRKKRLSASPPKQLND
jgi:four helix bundle protein